MKISSSSIPHKPLAESNEIIGTNNKWVFHLVTFWQSTVCVYKGASEAKASKSYINKFKNLIPQARKSNSDWLDSELIPRLLENFENWKNFIVILLNVKYDAYRPTFFLEKSDF